MPNMSDFSTRSRESLLYASKKIYEHKMEKIFGFKTLAEEVDDEIIKNLLVQVYTEEETFADLWASRISELGGQANAKVLFGDLKPQILSKILGTKGFFQWVLEEEEAGIKEVAIQAELIQDNVQSETWSRYASDEMRHLHRIRSEILGMDSWNLIGTNIGKSVSTIYSNLYGGLMSTLAFITGVFGSRSGLNFILISGLATLFAGSISSAGGGYQSLKVEMEVWTRESKRSSINRNTVPEDHKQLLEFYYSEGYSEEEANKIINSVNENSTSTIEDAIDKIGLASTELGDPINNGVTSGVTYAIAALIPILPFTIRSLELETALIISIGVTLLSLFIVGAAKSIFSRKKWIPGGLEVMIFGAIASTVTYIIGTLVSMIM